MNNQEAALKIPYGTRDYLPAEAADKRRVESAIAAAFAAWGYDEVVTPTIEYGQSYNGLRCSTGTSYV